MTNSYKPTKIQRSALNVLYSYSVNNGSGFTEELPNRTACEQAVRLVCLGFSTMEFILTELDPDDSGWSQWQDIINHLPH